LGKAACVGIAALTFVAIAVLRWPLAWVLLGLGGASCVWAYRVLGRVDAARTNRGAS
jgi:chromate transporter